MDDSGINVICVLRQGLYMRLEEMHELKYHIYIYVISYNML